MVTFNSIPVAERETTRQALYGDNYNLINALFELQS